MMKICGYRAHNTTRESVAIEVSKRGVVLDITLVGSSSALFRSFGGELSSPFSVRTRPRRTVRRRFDRGILVLEISERKR